MYVIDMLNLTDENVKGLDVNEVQFLRGKMWEHLHSDRVNRNFLCMVSNHYNQHMLDVGIVWKNYCTTAVSTSELCKLFYLNVRSRVNWYGRTPRDTLHGHLGTKLNLSRTQKTSKKR